MKTFNVGKINGIGNVKRVAQFEADFFEQDEFGQITFYVVNKKWHGEKTKIRVGGVNFRSDSYVVQEESDDAIDAGS